MSFLKIDGFTYLLWFRTFDKPSSSITEVGVFQPYILGSFGLVWILVFVTICFGVRWLGKVYAIFICCGCFNIVLLREKYFNRKLKAVK